MKDMPDTPVTEEVAIFDLVIADENPRNAEQIDETMLGLLADSIDHHGLMTPPIGYRHEDRIHVVAGGRRVRALQRLVETVDDWSETDTVPVQIVNRDRAPEYGQAEQLSHLALTSGDILRLMETPGYEDLSNEQLGQKIGRTPVFVAQHRKVLGLPDDIRAKMDAGRLTFQQLIGLTYWLEHGEDATRQAADNAERYQTPGGSIRSHALRDSATWSDNPWSKYVKQSAYIDAGGTIDGDLFHPGDGKISDPDMLATLGREAIEVAAREKFSDYGTVEIISADVDWQNWWNIQRGARQFHPDLRDYTAKEAKQIEKLNLDIEALHTQAEQDDRLSLTPEEQAQEEALEQKIEDIERARESEAKTPEVMAELKVLVRIDPKTSGGFDYLTNVLPDDTSKLVELGALDEKSEAAAGKTAKAEAKPAPVTEVTDSHKDRIKRLITHIAKIELMNDPQRVIALWAAAAGQRSDYGGYMRGFHLSPERFDQLPDDVIVRTTKAWDHAAGLAELNPKAVADLKPIDQRKLAAFQMVQLLSSDHEVRKTIKVADIRRHWDPDGDFFKRYKKPQLIHMLTKAKVGDAVNFEGKKVSGLIDDCLEHLATRDDFLPLGFESVKK